MTLFALLAALTTAQATASAPPVVWETPPRIEMPAKALETGVKSGVVVLRCDFTANGIPTVQTILRAASATAKAPPWRGSR